MLICSDDVCFNILLIFLNLFEKFYDFFLFSLMMKGNGYILCWVVYINIVNLEYVFKFFD